MAFQQFAETYLIPAQLICALFGMGATMSVKDFALVFKHPKGLLIGLVIQLLLVPLLAVAFIQAFGLTQGMAVGLLLIAVVPGGAASNLLTYLAKGHVPLSIAVTTTTTLACMATVPLWLSVLASQHLPVDFVFPTARIIRDIICYLLIPLSVGMYVFHKYPSKAAGLSKWAIRGSLTIIGIIAISSLGSGRIKPRAYGWQFPLTLFGFALTMAVVVPQLSRLAGRYDDESSALTIEAVIRNTNIGLLLLRFFFPGTDEQGKVLFAQLFYPGILPLILIPTILKHRWGRGAVLFRKPFPRPVPVLDAKTESGR